MKYPSLRQIIPASLAAGCALLALTPAVHAAPPAYQSAVLADSPFTYYEFGETSGATTAVDASANGFNGTYVGSPVLGMAGDNVGDTAVTFNGASQYVVCPSTPAALAFGADLTNASYEFVFKTAVTTNAGALLATANTGSTLAIQVWLNENAGGTLAPCSLRFFLRDGSGNTLQTAFANPVAFDGNYHHLVWTMSGGTATAYLDGVLQTTATTATVTNLGAFAFPLAVGCYDSRATYENFAVVTLDETAIYSSVLSPARIAAHFAALTAVIAQNGVASQTWVGNTDNNLATTANWTPTGLASGDPLIFGAAGGSGSALNNNESGFTFGGLTFGGTAPAYTIGGNSFTLGGNYLNASPSLQTISAPIVLGVTPAVNDTGGGTLLSGVLSGTGLGLTKTGTGTLTLDAANTFTGGLALNGGTSTLDFTQSGAPGGNIINAANPLTLGGGVLNIIGNTSITSSQTFAGTTVNPGFSKIVGNGVSAEPLTIALGALTHAAGGGTVDFTNAPGGSITTTSTAVNGILGGWATFGDSLGSTTTGDFVTVSGGKIVPYSSYTTVSATGSSSQTGSGASAQNWLCGALNGANEITVLSASATINSLVLQGDFSITNGATLTLGSGGLIMRGAQRWLKNPSAATGGTSYLTSGSGVLYVHAPNAAGANTDWRIWPIVEDGSTAVTLVKDGPGTVDLDNFMTYSGGTYVNGGLLQLYAGGATGDIRGFVVVNPGGTLLATVANAFGYTAGLRVNNAYINGGTLNTSAAGDQAYNTTFYLNGGTLTSNGGTSSPTAGSYWVVASDTVANGGASGINSLASPVTSVIAGRVDIRNYSYWPSEIFNVAAGTTPTGVDLNVSAAITGSTGGGTLGTCALVKTGAGTMLLSGANTFSGGFTNNAGTVIIGNNTALGGGRLTMNGGAITNNAGNSFNVANPVNLLATGSFGVNSGDTLTLAGVISNTGGLTKVGGGTLELTGAETYTGNTVIAGGTLALNGTNVLVCTNIVVSTNTTLDVSQITGGFILGAGQNLESSGTVNGSVTTVAGSSLYADAGAGYGTNTIDGNLTLAPGEVTYFNLGPAYAGANDQIVVNGSLVENGAVFINAPSASANLDTASDYVLLTSAGLSGTVSPTPIWGVLPLNWKHYTVAMSGNNIQLHYNSQLPPFITAAIASPSPATFNQSVLISVTVTSGTGTIDPNLGVTLNAGTLGLSAPVPLVLSGTANVYTNTIVVPANVSSGNYTLVATVTDSTPLSGSAQITLPVAAATDVWSGAGGDGYCDDGLNWFGNLAPGYVGDSLVFAGTVNTTPDLDHNYTVSSLTFSNNAGGFTLQSVENDTLTLTGNVTNNSANPQTLNLAVALTGMQTIATAAGNIAIPGNLSDGTSSGGLTVAGANTLTLTGQDTYSGLTSIQGGALAVTTGGTLGTLTQNIEIAPNTGTVAAFNVTNATINADRVIVAGISGNNTSPGAGTVNQSGGVINSAQWFTVGSGGSATGDTGGAGVYNLSGGGVLNLQNTAGGTQIEVANFTNATGVVTINDTSAINLWNNSYLSLGANAYSGNGTVIQNGGTVTFFSDGGNSVGGTGILYLGRAGGFTNTLYTYNLNAGTLTVPTITSASRDSLFYFNGGLLKAAQANATLMGGLTAAYVSAGGAIIDDGGYQVGVSQNLSHDPALGAAADGGLTKQDSGTVTLGGMDTYTGPTTINGGTLQLSEPVLHLSFDNVSGTTVVNQGSGGSAMNGTLTGTATIVAGGRFGHALSIPAGVSTNAYVLVNSPVVNFNEAGSWSWGLWVKTTTAGGCYMYQGNGTGWASGYTTFYLNNGAGAGTKAGGVRYGQGWEEGTAVINDGQWHFLAMTDNGGTRTMYVDGQVDALADNAWTGTGVGTELFIGGNGPGEGDGQVGLNGLIDEVYIYNRPLSQAEVQSLYTNNYSPVLPAATAVSVASGATLDVAGLTQAIGSLTGPGGSSVLLDDTAGAPGALTVGNANNTVYAGNLSDNSGAGALTKVGTGTLNLTGGNSYGGATTVSNGVLLVDSSLNGPVTVAAAGTLAGVGTFNGAVTVAGTLSAGDPAGVGTLTINNNLTFAPGGVCSLTLGNTYYGGNDQVVVSGALTNNNNVMFLNGLSTSVPLDTTGDYVLLAVNSGNITGSFQATPVWGVQPANYQYFVVLTNTTQVVLHYTGVLPPTATLSATSPVTRNQGVLVTATVTPGGNSITSVTLNAASLNGSAALPLVSAGNNVYTNTVVIPTGFPPGTYSLQVTVTDSTGLIADPITAVTVTVANDVWAGLGGDNFWDTNPNWTAGAAPGLTGDSLVFAGATRLTPSMDNSYSVTSVTFSNNAGSFNIGTANNSTLTLTGGVTNNSASVQTLNVPVALGAVQTFAVVSSNLVLAGVVSGAGGINETGSNTLTLVANNTYTGPTTVAGGSTLQLDNPNAMDDSALTLNSGAALQLRADATTTFTPGSLTLPTASDTLGLDVNSLTGATGKTLTLANALSFLSSSDQTLNVTGNSTYTLALGAVTLTTTAHTPFANLFVNTSPTGPAVTIASVAFGNWGSDLDLNGGGHVTITGNLTATSNGEVDLFVNNGTTVTLQGSTTGNSATPDGNRYIVQNGTLVLDNSTALVNDTTGAGLSFSVFALGAVTNSISGTTYSHEAGVVTTTNNSFNAAVFLGDATHAAGGLSVAATVTNYVSDGDVGFTNSGTFTIGGQNTSGINTYNNPIILGWTANRGKSVTLLATTGGEVDFAGPIRANGTDTTAGVTVGDALHAGTVKLIGANTYAGGTTLSNGTLLVNGSIAAGTVTVNSGAMTVNGSIGSGGTTVNGGSLTVSATGSIGSGGTTINAGAMTINGTVGGGAVTVSNATLTVNGVLNSASLNILNGGVLTGGGTIGLGVNNAVTNQAGGGLYPGQSVSTAGTVLSVGGRLVLQAGSSTTLAVSHNHATSDQIDSGAFYYGGTLTVVTNAGDAPLQAGDGFLLFNSPFSSWNGSFANLTLPALGPGLGWATNLTSGSLLVVPTVNTNPTNIVAALTNNVLTLSWPADHTGWRLLVQTNNLANGISANTNDWGTVPGSAATNSVPLTNNPALPDEFFRLVYP